MNIILIFLGVLFLINYLIFFIIGSVLFDIKDLLTKENIRKEKVSKWIFMSKNDLRTADECDGVHRNDYCKDCGCLLEMCCKSDGVKKECKRLKRWINKKLIESKDFECCTELLNELKKELK